MNRLDRYVMIGIGALGGAVLALILGLVIGGFTMGRTTMRPHMFGWEMHGVAPWWGIVMGIVWILVAVGVIFLLVSLLRVGQTRQTAGGPPEDRALQILRERYARGELTEEQYDAMRHKLE